MFQKVFSTNVIGPVNVYKGFLKFLMKSDKPVVINMSSAAGSVGMDLGAIAPAYCVSKAALNMLVSKNRRWFYFSHDKKQTYKLAKENPKIIAVVVSPGWVKTGMFLSVCKKVATPNDV